MIKEKKSGQLIVISAPSGCGKGSVINGLLEKNKNAAKERYEYYKNLLNK